jgi:hypothetical protein
MFGSCEVLDRAIAHADAVRTIERVKRLVSFIAIVFALSVGVGLVPAAASTSAKQLTTTFKKSTGQKLVLNKSYSSPGSYLAYDVGTQTFATRARWGTFTVYLVTASDVEAQVTRLLADTRTGTLGTPTAAKIYWESGATLRGDMYWQAKRRYGTNIVLHWIGPNSTKKTDATWKRLHTALTAATK